MDIIAMMHKQLGNIMCVLLLAIYIASRFSNALDYHNQISYINDAYKVPFTHQSEPQSNFILGLMDNYYNETCPYAELIVRYITQKHVIMNPRLPAHLLRLHFHDCFVRGCDGSILLNSTRNFTAEKDEKTHLNLKGFDVIEEIKTELENNCKGIVSCADILALAARDAVSFQYDRLLWRVPTGRRDGMISLASEVPSNIPSPFSNFTVQAKVFSQKGLTVHDLLTLIGAHTIGRGHCNIFSFRLFNFTTVPSLQDPSLDKEYGTFLKTICNKPIDDTTTVEMDPGSSLSFDSNYYTTMKKHRSLFYSDAQILTNNEARKIVNKLLNPKFFFEEFAKSVQKMGAMDVLSGNQGQIRRKCGLIN